MLIRSKCRPSEMVSVGLSWGWVVMGEDGGCYDMSVQWKETILRSEKNCIRVKWAAESHSWTQISCNNKE